MTQALCILALVILLIVVATIVFTGWAMTQIGNMIDDGMDQ